MELAASCLDRVEASAVVVVLPIVSLASLDAVGALAILGKDGEMARNPYTPGTVKAASRIKQRGCIIVAPPDVVLIGYRR